MTRFELKAPPVHRRTQSYENQTLLIIPFYERPYHPPHALLPCLGTCIRVTNTDATRKPQRIRQIQIAIYPGFL